MSVAVPFNRTFECEYGVAETVTPGLRRIVANNPSQFTFKGTNTYIAGRGSVALIDPGPDDEAHRAAILGALAGAGERITHIFLTHTHKDHSAGLARLAELTGAEVLGYGARAEITNATQLAPDAEPHLEADFVPDRVLRGGEVVRGGDWALEAVHTPGHSPDHICYAVEGTGALLTGDHIMGWNTTVVAPPEGRMADYLRSLEKLMQRAEDIYFPGHGGCVDQGRRLARIFITHRKWREAQILDCLRQGLDTIDSIVPRIYEGLEAHLMMAASYSVLSHLEMLTENGSVHCQDRPTLTSRFRLAGAP